MQVILAIYGILALTHIGGQLALAVTHHLRFRQRDTPLPEAGWPSATVIVTAYREDPDELRACLLSISQQDYPGLRAICVDDGTRPLPPGLRFLYDEAPNYPSIEVLELEQNVGKRNAQAAAMKHVTSEVVITMDSDTTLPDRASLRRLVRGLHDPKVGAVTGSVMAANFGVNLLTRLTSLRYWNAFHQERAAQSLFRTVMCCSGPLAAYRRCFLEEVEHEYLNERFLGRTCTFGDDRHLTNLALQRGWQTKFVPDAHALTIVPHRLRQYVKQQVRWNKSFYREALWTFRRVRSRNLYLWYSLAMQVTLPLLFLGAAGALLVRAAGDPGLLWKYALVMVGIGLLRVLYGLVRTRDSQFILFSLFGVLYMGVVLPTRLYALVTIGRTGWGTR